MRRILLLVALVVPLLAAVPAGAAPHTGGAVMAAHFDGRYEFSKGWYNPDNGRTYRFEGYIDTEHDPAAGTWLPRFQVTCTRTYGNLTVQSPCDFHGTFKALVSSNGSSINSVGSRGLRNIFGTNLCITQLADRGSARAYGSSYPYGMSYVENFEVDFLTATGCNHVHTTRTYDIGSYLVKFTNETRVTHALTGIAG